MASQYTPNQYLAERIRRNQNQNLSIHPETDGYVIAESNGESGTPPLQPSMTPMPNAPLVLRANTPQAQTQTPPPPPESPVPKKKPTRVTVTNKNRLRMMGGKRKTKKGKKSRKGKSRRQRKY